MSAKRHVLAVPVEHALAFTADRGWHVIAAPPDYWLEEREHELLEDEVRLCGPQLQLVPDPPPPLTDAEAFERQGYLPGRAEWLAARRHASGGSMVSDVEGLKRSYAAGYTFAELGAALGVSPGTVRNRLLAAGVTPRRRGRSEDVRRRRALQGMQEV